MFNRRIFSASSRNCFGVLTDRLRRKAIQQENSSDDVLSHTFNLCQTVVQHKGFRTEVFTLLLKLYEEILEKSGNADYRNVCRCQYFLGNYEAVANILSGLLDS